MALNLCRIVENLFLQYDMNIKLASGFADCCEKFCKNTLPLCPTSQNVVSQEEHILIHILLEQALQNIFRFLFFSCRGSMTIFLASPPDNVLTPRMSQGHINIQILSNIWIKHCNVWTVFSIDVLMSWFCLMRKVIKVRQALTPPI